MLVILKVLERYEKLLHFQCTDTISLVQNLTPANIIALKLLSLEFH